MVDGTGTPAPLPANGHYKGEFAEEIVTLDRLAKKLRAARFKNGAVKFDSEELHFEVDEKGKPIRCFFKRSKDANKLIEEFMLLANRTVAESVGRRRHHRYQLGDAVRIQVARANLDKKQLDFTLVESEDKTDKARATQQTAKGQHPTAHDDRNRSRKKQ